MSKLPSLKRINMSDMPGAPEYLKALVLTLNNFFQFLFSALDRNLTLKENLKSEFVELELFAPISDFRIPTKLFPVSLVLLGRVTGLGITAPPTVQWHQDRDSVVIDTISGLTTGERYRITLVIL